MNEQLRNEMMDATMTKINALTVACNAVFDDINIIPFSDNLDDCECGIKIFIDCFKVTVKYISGCSIYQLTVNCTEYINSPAWIDKLPLTNAMTEMELMQFIKTIIEKLEF